MSDLADIPVPAVPADDKVILRGRVALEVIFERGALEGLDYDQIKQKVYDVLEGNSGWWLPEVKVGDMTLFRVEDEPRE